MKHVKHTYDITCCWCLVLLLFLTHRTIYSYTYIVYREWNIIIRIYSGLTKFKQQLKLSRYWNSYNLSIFKFDRFSYFFHLICVQKSVFIFFVLFFYYFARSKALLMFTLSLVFFFYIYVNVLHRLLSNL